MAIVTIAIFILALVVIGDDIHLIRFRHSHYGQHPEAKERRIQLRYGPKSFIVYRIVRGEPLTSWRTAYLCPCSNESFFWRSNPGVLETKRQPRARFLGTLWNTF